MRTFCHGQGGRCPSGQCRYAPAAVLDQARIVPGRAGSAYSVKRLRLHSCSMLISLLLPSSLNSKPRFLVPWLLKVLPQHNRTGAGQTNLRPGAHRSGWPQYCANYQFTSPGIYAISSADCSIQKQLQTLRPGTQVSKAWTRGHLVLRQRDEGSSHLRPPTEEHLAE